MTRAWQLRLMHSDINIRTAPWFFFFFPVLKSEVFCSCLGCSLSSRHMGFAKLSEGRPWCYFRRIAWQRDQPILTSGKQSPNVLAWREYVELVTYSKKITWKRKRSRNRRKTTEFETAPRVVSRHKSNRASEDAAIRKLRLERPHLIVTWLDAERTETLLAKVECNVILGCWGWNGFESICWKLWRMSGDGVTLTVVASSTKKSCVLHHPDGFFTAQKPAKLLLLLFLFLDFLSLLSLDSIALLLSSSLWNSLFIKIVLFYFHLLEVRTSKRLCI